MNNTANNFLNTIDAINDLLEQSKAQKNPALYLFNNNARAILFKLEGLCRLYKNLHNKKRFEKLQTKAKELEDALGVIDYYNALAQNPAIIKDKKIFEYFSAELADEFTFLNALLEVTYFKKANFKKAKKKITSAKWLSAEKEAQKIAAFYEEEKKELKLFASSLGYTDMELHVHELRRKLRWLSIYAQATNGLIQLTNETSPIFNAYKTKEIVSSPFNALPKGDGLPYHVWLHGDAFYALSWLIQELGSLKDKGLTIAAIENALHKINTEQDSAAVEQKALQILNTKETELALLDKAKFMTEKFIKDGALDLL